MRKIVGLLIAVLVLAGCSDGSDDQMVGPVDATTTTVETIGTVQQYASAVASAERGVREQIDKFSAECDGLRCSVLGQLAVGTMADTAEILFIEVQLVQRPGSGPTDFKLEHVPAEIQTLVDDTLLGAAALSDAASDAEACVRGDFCEGELIVLSSQASKMTSLLDAWAPYL